MKIAITTFHFPLNYGAALQAYALTEALRLMGHQVEIIDYRPDYHCRHYRWNWKWGGLHPKNLIFTILRRRFSNFTSRYMPLTTRRYHTLQELADTPPTADAFICGSDQIWNPDLTGIDPAYLLSFVPEGRRRIAYAASFGKTALTAEQRASFAPHLEKLDYVSVREKAGVELVKDLCGRQAEHVLDPTLLIGDYSAITKVSEKRGRYVLLINLQNNKLLKQSARFVAKSLGLPVVVLNNYSLKDWTPADRRRFPSPEGYLRFIQQASFVVTNSFHGTVFAIILQRPFLTTALAHQAAQRNSRITGLLDTTRLSERFVEEYDETKIHRIHSTPIDWEAVSQRIGTYRANSLDFLGKALQ